MSIQTVPIRTVGIHSPGDMGQAVGKVLSSNGLHVIAALANRSERTRKLAQQAKIVDVGDMNTLVQEADIILSILPPGNALDALLETIRAMMHSTNSFPIYVDCNALSSQTSQQMERMLEAIGGQFVDASIIGPPPRDGNRTRFYASGPHAAKFVALKEYGLDIVSLGEQSGLASDIKTCYASFTKGMTALALNSLIAADRINLYQPFVEELMASQPASWQWMQKVLPGALPKAHRWVGEMEEHGKTLSAAGLSASMMEGAAALYAELANTVPGQEAPEDHHPTRTFQELIALLSPQFHQLKEQTAQLEAKAQPEPFADETTPAETSMKTSST